jgi:hypothetical protein
MLSKHPVPRQHAVHQLPQCKFSQQVWRANAGVEDAGQRLHGVAEQRRRRHQARLEAEEQAVREMRSSFRARSPGREAQVGSDGGG